MTDKLTASESETGQHRYFFTILTPTYNRAHTLPRTYESLKKQGFQDFEWLIVDDGSTDNTKNLVQQWQKDSDFPVRYYWQENQGKHIAHNTGVYYASGKLTVVLDSDDLLADEALVHLKQHWDTIPREKRHQFAGVEGLAAYFNGQIEGTRFPKNVMDSDYIEIRSKHGVTGDKKGAVVTDILKEFVFPQFPGEKHVRPSLLWKQLAHHYQFRYINEIIQLKELQPGGLSSNRFRLRTKNPQGFRFYYREEINKHGKYDGIGKKLNNCAQYVRYSLHSRIGYRQQQREIDTPWLWLLSIPKGTLIWLRDRIKLRHGQ